MRLWASAAIPNCRWFRLCTQCDLLLTSSLAEDVGRMRSTRTATGTSKRCCPNLRLMSWTCKRQPLLALMHRLWQTCDYVVRHGCNMLQLICGEHLLNKNAKGHPYVVERHRSLQTRLSFLVEQDRRREHCDVIR